MNKGLIPKGIDRNPAQNSPDIHRGKAIAATASGIVVGGSLSALTICVLSIVGMIILCVFWGFFVAIGAL